VLVGAKCAALIAKAGHVEPVYSLHNDGNLSSSVSAVFRTVIICCIVAMRVTTYPSVVFPLVPDSDAFPIWSFCSGVLDLAAGAAVVPAAAAYLFPGVMRLNAAQRPMGT
jgi:hypothetical protein